MDYMYLGIGIVVGFHALTYAYWLKKNGHTAGAVGISILVIASLALQTLRMYK